MKTLTHRHEGVPSPELSLLVPKLCLGIEPAGAVRDGRSPKGERSGEREPMPMSWQLRCLSRGETEFRRQARSQTEFGNEGRCNLQSYGTRACRLQNYDH